MTVADTAFNHIRSLVRARSAIVLDDGKTYLVEQRLLPIAQAHGLSSIDALAAQLTPARPELVDEVVQAMTTNETSFFRDIHPFEALRSHLLPRLIDARRRQRRLRIWSGASSSGQEAYSIAILIFDHFPELRDWDVEILGTDLNLAVLARARHGRYRQLEVNRGLASQQLLKHFDRVGLEWSVKPHLRRIARFSPLNLTASWASLPRFDVVFLRNVLIYFDADAKHHILSKVRAQLACDGYLFLGGAETTLNVHAGFDRLPFDRASCYRIVPEEASCTESH